MAYGTPGKLVGKYFLTNKYITSPRWAAPIASGQNEGLSKRGV